MVFHTSKIVRSKAPTCNGEKSSVNFTPTINDKNIKIGTVKRIETVLAPIAIFTTLCISSFFAALIAVKSSGAAVTKAIKIPTNPAVKPKLLNTSTPSFAKISERIPIKTKRNPKTKILKTLLFLSKK